MCLRSRFKTKKRTACKDSAIFKVIYKTSYSERQTVRFLVVCTWRAKSAMLLRKAEIWNTDLLKWVIYAYTVLQ